MTFAGIVACQVGTAIAARTEHASLRSVGFFTQPAAALGHRLGDRLRRRLIYAPPLQQRLRNRPARRPELAFLLTFPLIVWGADELRRWLLRRQADMAPA